MQLYQGDTIVCLKRPQLKRLNQRIALLSEYKLTSDSIMAQQDTLLNSCKKDKQDLWSIIEEKDKQLSGKQDIINLGDMKLKNTRRSWIKRGIGIGAGGLAVGLSLGLIIPYLIN